MRLMKYYIEARLRNPLIQRMNKTGLNIRILTIEQVRNRIVAHTRIWQIKDQVKKQVHASVGQ